MRVNIKHEMDKYARKYRALGDGMIRTAIRRTVNDAARRSAKPLMQNTAKFRGGWDKIGETRKRVKAFNSAAGDLTSRAVAAQKHYSLVNKFSPSSNRVPGGAFRSAVPWGQARTYRHGFYITSRFNGELVPVTRIGKGRNHYKAIYGPSVPREIERDLKESKRILHGIERYVIHRAAHHFAFAEQQARARAGL